MSDILFKQIYSTQRRGTTTRAFVPKALSSFQPGGMPTQTDVTVAGDKLFLRGNARKFFEFQNKDTVNDMTIAFGQPASAISGVLIGPLGSARWEIEVPAEEVHVFCTVAGAAFSFQERLAS